MMMGFFLIYLIEELVHNYLHRHQHKKQKALKEKNRQSSEFGDAFIRGLDVRNSAIMRGFPDSQNSISDLIAQDQLDNAMQQKDSEAQAGHGHSHALPLPHSDDEDFLVSSLRGLLIVLALSIHELFEGFAVGLEKTSASELPSCFIYNQTTCFSFQEFTSCLQLLALTSSSSLFALESS